MTSVRVRIAEHAPDGFGSDLMSPSSYRGFCRCGYSSIYYRTIDEARKSVSSHVYLAELPVPEPSRFSEDGLVRPYSENADLPVEVEGSVGL